MTPPLTCPPPDQRDEPDCPLYNSRLTVVSEEAALRRLILAERNRHVGLSALIRAEAATEVRRARPALPPAPEPFPLPTLNHFKEEGTP